jgi:hypothetical protein
LIAPHLFAPNRNRLDVAFAIEPDLDENISSLWSRCFFSHVLLPYL